MEELRDTLGSPPAGDAPSGAVPPYDPRPDAASLPAPPAPREAAASLPDASPLVMTDWCLDGLAVLDEETCYVLADAANDGAPSARVLLVYLHGIVPPAPNSEQKERVERAVLYAAKRAGAAALVPRGLRGIGPGAARDWWAWPTEPGAHAKYAATLVAKWADARRRLERIAGASFARTYLAGSSNGAYFLTALALGGELVDHSQKEDIAWGATMLGAGEKKAPREAGAGQ